MLHGYDTSKFHFHNPLFLQVSYLDHTFFLPEKQLLYELPLLN